MLHETLRILEQGYYVKNGRRVQLKLSRRDMEEVRVYLPDDVKKCGSREDFTPPYVIGRCGYGYSYIAEVKGGTFPAPEHKYKFTGDKDEFAAFLAEYEKELDL